MNTPGRDALWQMFGLSYASWLVMPRALMHEMPDEWQAKMAALMQEYSDQYPNVPDLSYTVTIKQDGKFAPMPDWVAYRHPDRDTIESFKC